MGTVLSKLHSLYAFLQNPRLSEAVISVVNRVLGQRDNETVEPEQFSNSKEKGSPKNTSPRKKRQLFRTSSDEN